MASVAAALSKAHYSQSLVLGQTVNARNLLYYVRDQKAQTARYDSVELRDIVEKSTEWASGTQFGYIYQHQNIENNINLSVGTVESGMGGENEFDPLDTLWIISIPEKQHLQLRVYVRSHVASEGQISSLLEDLCQMIENFSASPDQPLCSLIGA
ncbi:hypothetical protein EYZ11_013088 [Aspergillus tanneri]|uniref:Condensation domain-containing protein n=1 Tax=Aspergillus tanneri TaxID=1220188 RepID=A0A4S3IYJ3_9EURO|nr:hypothetical protein EYZ11_013088 [Aspergillus tanneri]